MKTLLTVSMALDISEDDLAAFAQKIEDGMRRGITQALLDLDRIPTREDLEAAEELVDFYGATLTLKQPMFGERVL